MSNDPYCMVEKNVWCFNYLAGNNLVKIKLGNSVIGPCIPMKTGKL